MIYRSQLIFEKIFPNNIRNLSTHFVSYLSVKDLVSLVLVCKTIIIPNVNIDYKNHIVDNSSNTILHKKLLVYDDLDLFSDAIESIFNKNKEGLSDTDQVVENSEIIINNSNYFKMNVNVIF